jgi:ABC-type branched-subunit amino acid transport system permease subunit
LLAIAVAFPFVFPSPFLVNFGVLALFYAFIGQSWNIAGGFAGQLSFGHVAFFGVGAYASTMVQMRHELVKLWDSSTSSSEQLLHDLQAWCQRAQQSGIASLEEFALRLRRYAA